MKLIVVVILCIRFVISEAPTRLRHTTNLGIAKLSSTFAVRKDIDAEFQNPDDYSEFSSRLLFGLGKCTEIRCSAPFGTCINSTKCGCHKGYLNYSGKEAVTKYCTYEQKKQKTAVLLEIFTVIGGDLYLGCYRYALIKASMIICLTLIFLFSLPCKLLGIREMMNEKVCFSKVNVGNLTMILTSVLLWQFADLIRIISNKMTDSNNMPLLFGL